MTNTEHKTVYPYAVIDHYEKTVLAECWTESRSISLAEYLMDQGRIVEIIKREIRPVMELI